MVLIYKVTFQKLLLKKNKVFTLTLNAPEIHLKMSSAGFVCCKYLPYITHDLSIEANKVYPEQTAPIGSV